MTRFFFLFLVLLFHLTTYAHEGDGQKKYSFIENKGQWEPAVKFRTELGEATVFFEENAFHYQVRSIPDFHMGNIPDDTLIRGHVFKSVFKGANKNIKIDKKGQSSYYNNYFLGNDESKWKSDVRSYQEIIYQNIYNGIDVKVYCKDNFLKYDYEVAPGSNVKQILIQYLGVAPPVIRDGNLVISHSLGELIEERPYAYQEIDGVKNQVACAFSLDKSGNVFFNFPEGYDKNLPLVIDPELIFSTYSGSVADNWGMSATYDNRRNGYAGGLVFSVNYIQTPGAYQTFFGGGDVDIAISKYFSEGDSLIYATFLGGSSNETVHSMVVDDSENLYLLGATNSTNFPVSANAFKKTKTSSSSTSTEITEFSSGSDIIISKLNSSGSQLMSSTYFGGNANDGINFPLNSTFNSYSTLRYNYGDSHRGEIVLDSNGNCYIGTSTSSSNINALNSYSNNQDGLIVKFSNDLSNVIWSRYHGGSEADAIYSLKVIDSDKVLIGGGTTSFSDFPTTTGSYSANSFGGRSDGFISIISADGSIVEKSTYIGTSDYDQVYFIEFDRFKGVYGFGQSRGGLFPIKNAPLAMPNTGQFFVKLDKNLDSLAFSTTFGDSTANGQINISPTAFLVDRCQNIYASGWGEEIVGNEGAKNLPSNMPRANISRPQLNFTDGNDFYLYVINRDVDSLLYASFLGGTSSDDHIDGGTSRFDKEGIIYQSVCASCRGNLNDFPTKNAFSSTNNSTNCNNALFKFDFEILPKAKFSVSKIIGCSPFTVTLRDSSKNAAELTYDFFGTIVSDFDEDTTFTIITPGTYFIEQIAKDTICDSESRFGVQITVRPNDLILTVSSDTNVCTSDSLLVTANINKPNIDFSWSRSPSFTNVINSNNNNSIKIKPVSGREVFYIRAQEQITNPCAVIDSVVINFVNPSSTASISNDTICEDNSVTFFSSFQDIDRFRWNFGNGVIDSINQNPSRVYQNAGFYTISLITSNDNCPFNDTNMLTLEVKNNNLILNSLNDTISCNQQAVKLNLNSNGTANSFLWSSSILFNNILNSSLQDSTLTASPLNPTKYYARISDEFCTLIDSVFVDAVQYNFTFGALPDSVCLPFEQQLVTNVNGLDSFRIDLGNGMSTNSSSTPFLSLTQEGVYNIKLAGYNNKCMFSDTLTETISTFEKVRLKSISDTTICFGDEITLKANSFGTANSFVWDTRADFSSPLNLPGDSTVKVNPETTTRYFLKVSNGICDTTASQQVQTEVVEIEVDDFFNICIDDTVSINSISSSSTNNLTYLWSPPASIISGQGTPSVIVSPKNDLTLFLETTSAINCKDSDYVDIQVNLPAFDDVLISATDDTLFKGQTIQLSTNRERNDLVYEWEPVNGLNDPNAARPTARPAESITYKVTITDLTTTCKVSALKSLFVFEINCNEPEIFIPTAFTPNNDLTNDVLYVRGDNISEMEFQLFNRWGELVFETNELNTGWDGTYKGKEADPGVFVFQLKVVCLDGQQYYKKGNITLIR